MKNIALINGHSISFFNEWHHVGCWKRTFDEMDDVTLHLYTWDNWHTMPSGLDLYLFLDYRPSLWQVAKYNYHPRVLFWWDACYSAKIYGRRSHMTKKNKENEDKQSI